jgi:hypothetical protein
MKLKLVCAILVVNACIIANALAQTLPLVYNNENTGADCPKPPLLGIELLPNVEPLPDPFAWEDGRGRVTGFSDWRYRRAEIKAEIENYEIGVKPPRPDTITATYAAGKLIVNVTKNGQTLTLTSTITLPSGTGPFPAVIGMNSPSGSIPSDIFTSRNIAMITYSHNQVVTYGSKLATDPYYKLYPDLFYAGQYSSWAWGVSRIIDGLELVKDVLPIDLKHLAVTGCSYAGKMALFAGAFDERIALTIAEEPGGGGAAAWRVSQTLPNVENLGSTDHKWFMESMFKFSGANVSKLPHDHHELCAMVAPRALFVLGNPTQVWLADESGYVSCRAAHQVWKAFGIGDRFGFSFVGGHNHCALPTSQRPEVTAFVDKFLLGKDTTNTDITTNSFTTDLSRWINWSQPTLTNVPSYFAQTSPTAPANLLSGTPTTMTFKWNKVPDAVQYIIQLSTSSGFGSNARIDSTADTVTTISGLAEGATYYWRVRVKNGAGAAGPYSDVWRFTTYVDLPLAPRPVSATQVSNRSDFIQLKWNKGKNAGQYMVNVSDDRTFASVYIRDSTGTDTVKTLGGNIEGQLFYWRVQSKNVTGVSAWSDVSNFTLVLKPTELAARISGTNEITLSWNNHSGVSEGCVIERRQFPQTSFTVIDTILGSASEYIDKNAAQAQTYSYRIKAYKQQAASDYSDEVSLLLTGVNKEEMLPTEYALRQNYPNPFNPSTTISFGLPSRSFVSLKVFDVMGRDVATLTFDVLNAGTYSRQWNAGAMPGGVYFYRLQAGAFTETRSLILLK